MPFNPSASFEVVEEPAPSPFDPAKPFDVIEEPKGGFDPSKPFEVVAQPELVTAPVKQPLQLVNPSARTAPGTLPDLGEAFTPPEFVSKALDQLIPSFKPESEEMKQIVGMMGLQPTQAILETVSEKLKGAVGSILSPGGVALGVAAPLEPAVVGGIVSATSVPGVVEGVKETAKGIKEGSPAGIVGGALSTGLNALGVVAGAAGMLGEKPTLLKRSDAELAKIPGERTSDASTISETTTVHGDVRPLAGEGEGKVPVEESGAGVQPQAERGLPRQDDAAAKEAAANLSRNVGEVIPSEEAKTQEAGKEVLSPNEAVKTPLTGENAPVPQLTAAMNERIDMQRADRGEAPLMDPVRKADSELWDAAMRRIDADPALPEKLTTELLEKPRPMTDEETVILDRHMADLKNQQDQAIWEGIKAGDEAEAARESARVATDSDAREAGTVAEANATERAQAAEARSKEIGERLSRVEEAIGREQRPGGPGAGTLMGRAFRARQILMREDFSYAGIRRKMREAKGFKPLNESELAFAKKKADEFRVKNEQLEKLLKEQTEVASKAQAARELAELQAAQARAQAAVSDRVKAIVKKVGETLDKRADAARERLKGKLLSLSPEDLRDIADIAASNLYHIGEDLARWSAKMVEEFGEKIKPHLDDLWKSAKASLDEAVNVTAQPDQQKGRQSKVAPKEVADAREIIAARLRKKIQEYKDRIARGDFSTKKRPPQPTSKEIQKLQFELEDLKREIHEGLIEQKMKRRTKPEKIFGGFIESLNAMRAVKTSADLSAVLRQGGLVVMAHPIRSAKSIWPMLRAFASERNAFAVDREIRSRPNYPLYRASKLYLAEHGFSLSKMEEQYMSRFASKIPLVGPMVKASERAYITFLNKLRADSFDAMKATLGRGGDVSLPEAKIISNFVNVMTGRGTLSMKDQAAANLSAVFFAPRYVASRFQVLGLQPLYYGVLSGKVPMKGTMKARALVASEYARILGGAAVIYSLGLAAGGIVETDPRSSDFGKIRFGNTRLDMMAGLIQQSVLLSKIISGGKKNLRTSGIEPLRGPNVKYGGPTVSSEMMRYLRFKLAPAPGIAWDIIDQKDAIGNKITLQSELAQAGLPLSLMDVYQTMREQGVPSGLALSTLSIFGAGVQNFDAQKKLKGEIHP